jgi:site-specific DNA recombinase
MKITGYVRTTRTEERAASVRSLDEQELILRAFARERGHTLLAVHRDQGLAAGDPDRSTRAGLMALLDSMGDGWEAAVVVSLDRIATKDMSSLDVIQELSENGKRCVALGEPSATHLLAAARRSRLVEVRARPPVEARPPVGTPASPEDERRRIAERLLRGREAGARAGKHQSGPAPYGYRRDYSSRSSDGVLLKIDEHESEIVKFVFREYLRVRSMKRLIELLEEKRCRTRRGKQWSRAGVSWILKNDTYVGRVHFGSIRTRGRHTPLVSPIIFNKVQKLIRKNDKRHKRAEVPVETDATAVRAASATPASTPSPQPATTAAS